MQVKERTELKTENKELTAELAKAQSDLLVKEACDDSTEALLAIAETDLCEANERADKAEREVEWLNDNRTAWVQGLLNEIDKAFIVFSADTHRVKQECVDKENEVYHALLDNLHRIVGKHFPSTPTSTKRATSPTIKDEPGNDDKRAHLA